MASALASVQRLLPARLTRLAVADIQIRANGEARLGEETGPRHQIVATEETSCVHGVWRGMAFVAQWVWIGCEFHSRLMRLTTWSAMSQHLAD